MNFDFTPEQDEAAELAARILADRVTQERQKAVEAGGSRYDHELWQDLADAGLVSLALPERYGGAGLGLIELCRVLVEIGRTVAPVPLAVHGPATLLLAEAGSEEQREHWLYGAATGERLFTVAVAEELAHLPARPTVTWADGRLDGSKVLVRAGDVADAFLVTAATPTGVGVFLVEAGTEGMAVLEQHLSDGDRVARLDLSGVTAEQVGDATAATRLGQLLTVAAAAEQLGVTEGALALTASYAKSREQFGRPIGTFQAVSQRLADGYIDTLGQSLTLWAAAWRLQEGLSAEVEVATAKLWAADAGHRLAHTTVHVHGGVGIDLDGEAHRYFTAAKRFEFAYGGGTEQALHVGRVLAADPA
jgi:alkylation response protein AidB-like acyl-CoA dehydrogenase